MRSSSRLPSALALLAGLLLFPQPASAGSTFTVNSAANGPGDAAAGDGSCDDGNGVCTLLGAIQEANAHTGSDAISFNIAPGGVQVISPFSDFPEITDPVTIDGSTQPGGGDRGIVISGPNSFDLFHITAGQSLIRGLVINGGISTTTILIEEKGGNTVEGNYLGMDPSGTSVIGASFGVKIDNSSDNVVQGNLITTHGFADVEIFGADASGNQIIGNRIGTDASGTVRLEGEITVEASNNTVADNLICPGGFGVEIEDNPTFPATGNVLQGNLIGTDVTGTASLDCSAGVSVGGADTSGNLIGGPGPGEGNVIAGSGVHGLRIAGGGENVVQGNHIGTDITGTVALPNNFWGIEIASSSNNLIGGTESGAGNLISGNGPVEPNKSQGGAIHITIDGSTGNLVQGNRIGTDASGAAPLGNGMGILFTDEASGNTIGGTTPGAGNVIAYNELQAVWVPDDPIGDPVANSVLGNSIHDNGYGIDVGDAGVTPNDPGDADVGGNLRQNFPVLGTAGPAGGGTYVTGSLDSIPGTSFRIELFSSPACSSLGQGEGETFLGHTTVTTNGAGQASFALTTGAAPVGSVVTATATNQSTADTSEFSACEEVLNEADLVTTKAAAPVEVPPGGTITYTLTVSNPSGPAEATNVLITDPIPPDTSFVAGSLDDDPACAYSSVLNQVECAVGAILPTASLSVDFEVQVSDDALVPSIVTNTASTTLSTPDPDPSNNAAATVTDVDCDLVGTPLNDVLQGGPGIVSICGLDGNDHLLGKDGSEILVGGLGADKLDGNLGDDVLLGGSGNDLLFGQAGNDILRGGKDDDTLKGGPDDDELDGGAGTDACDQQGGAGSVTACEP